MFDVDRLDEVDEMECESIALGHHEICPGLRARRFNCTRDTKTQDHDRYAQKLYD